MKGPILSFVLQILDPLLLPPLSHLIQKVISKLGVHVWDVLSDAFGGEEPNCLRSRQGEFKNVWLL